MFVDKLLELLKSKNITKNKFLTDVKLSRNSFVDWTNRGNIPNGDVLLKIADYFDVSVDYLLDNDDIPNVGNSTFYQNLENLCKENGTTVTAVVKELKLSTSKVTAWKNGSVPNGNILVLLANYFNVSVDYLLGKASPTPEQTDSFTEESADLTPDERSKVEEYIKFIKSQRQ